MRLSMIYTPPIQTVCMALFDTPFFGFLSIDYSFYSVILIIAKVEKKKQKTKKTLRWLRE